MARNKHPEVTEERILDVAQQLFLEKGLVATVPCTAFAAPGFVRWSYATSLAEIDKGLDRLEEFIKNA